MADAENGNGHARAAAAVLKLDGSPTLALLARERGLSPQQLLTRLAGIIWEAAEAGDVKAAIDLRSYIAASWVGSGATSSKQMFKRVRRGLARGILSLDEGSKALKFVQVARELETSDLDRRLRALETVAGTALRARASEEEVVE